MLCFTRPRYQVSVYRTIGTLVQFFFFDFFKNSLVLGPQYSVIIFILCFIL